MQTIMTVAINALVLVLPAQTFILWWFMDVLIGNAILAAVGVNIASTIGGLGALHVTTPCAKSLLRSAPKVWGTRWMEELAEYLEYQDDWYNDYPGESLDEEGNHHDKMRDANVVASRVRRSWLLDGTAFYGLLAFFLAVSFIIYLSSYSYIFGGYERGLIAARWNVFAFVGIPVAYILTVRLVVNVRRWWRVKTTGDDDR